MLAASVAAFDFGKQSFGKICVAGTVLFLVSDSILAINRFAAAFEYAPAFGMLTYAAAQLFIAEGSLRNLQNPNLTPSRQTAKFFKILSLRLGALALKIFLISYSRHRFWCKPPERR